MFGRAPFDPNIDIPKLQDKVVLITGANSGLGKEHLRHLVKAGVQAKLYLGARNQDKAEAVISELESLEPNVKIHFLRIDLSSLASAKEAADTFKRENDRLDILVNNAGIMACPPGLTQDGYEVQFGTNHIGHFLLTRELLPLLRKTAAAGNDVRILNLSSEGHKLVPSSGFLPDTVTTDMATYTTWTRYGQSKLANILFTRELSRLYPEITSVAIHPGFVATNLANTFFGQSIILTILSYPAIWLGASTSSKGAYNQVWASVADLDGKEATGSKSPRKVQQGGYYRPVAKLGGDSGYAKDPTLAKKLWDWSESEMLKKGY